MGTLTISNEFVNGTPADATKMNTNFTDITTVVNTGLTNENINAAAAIVEAKIAFSASTGHTHNGTNSTLAALAVAGDGGATAGAQGTVRFKTGTVDIADGDSVTLTYAESFTGIPLVLVYVDGTSLMNLGDYLVGYYYEVSLTTLVIYNETGPAATFRWIAIGV
jgi:hypothetical protein